MTESEVMNPCTEACWPTLRPGSQTPSAAGPQLIRGALVEAAWTYRHRPMIGATLRRRQAGCPAETLARSWKAQQQRLHATYAKLIRRGKIPSVAVTAARPRARRVRVGRADQLTR
jgi:hypothetical protein